MTEQTLAPHDAGPQSAQTGPPEDSLRVKRSVIRVILLSIVSIGVYSLYWFYVTRKQINHELGLENKAGLHTLGQLVPILNFVLIYWLWRDINIARRRVGLEEFPAVVYLVLSIFGLSFIFYPLVVSKLNEYWDRRTEGRARDAKFTPAEGLVSFVPPVVFGAIIAAVIIAASSSDTTARPAGGDGGRQQQQGAANETDTGEETAVKGAVLAYLDAARKGDEDVYCGIETSRLLKEQTGQGGAEGIVACTRGMKPVEDLPRADTIQFSEVEVNGRRATAAIRASNGTGQVQLRKSEGRWKIDDIK